MQTKKYILSALILSLALPGAARTFSVSRLSNGDGSLRDRSLESSTRFR